MEAPEKIYLYPDDRAGYEYEAEWGDKPWGEGNVEYIRTDAFIEKAERFLKEWDAYSVCLEGHKDWFIEQFKKYMEE